MHNFKPLILVVDDDIKCIKLAEAILVTQGYEVIKANDYKECLTQLEKHPNIDLIMLDVMMPDMDGFDICSLISKDEVHKDVPVIFITALNDDISQLNGFKAGGVDFISKPLQRDILSARVKVHIKLKCAQESLKILLAEKEKLINDLNDAMENIKTLKGILPICSCCKKIRDDKGYWSQVETYISKHSDAVFSHSMCIDCAKKLYPDIDFDSIKP